MQTNSTLLATDSFGSLADLQDDISLMAAFGVKADVKTVGFTRF
jgi:hypothetical protein